jgi:hypothetical protein
MRIGEIAHNALVASGSWARRRARRTFCDGKGVPNWRALFCTQDTLRLSATDARATHTPASTKARKRSICSGVHVADVMCGMGDLPKDEASARDDQLWRSSLRVLAFDRGRCEAFELISKKSAARTLKPIVWLNAFRLPEGPWSRAYSPRWIGHFTFNDCRRVKVLFP